MGDLGAVGAARSSTGDGGRHLAGGTGRWRASASAQLAAFLLLHSLAVVAGRASRTGGSETTTFWPAAAVAFVWLGTVWHQRGRRRTAAAGIAVSAGAGLALTGMAVPVALACSAAVLAQAWVAAWLFARRRPSLRLVAPADAWGLTGAALAGSVVGALVATVSVGLLLGDVHAAAVLSWVVRMSTAVVAAGLWLLLADSSTDRAPVQARWGELVLVNLGALGAFVWLFDVEHVYSLAFLTVPVTVWIGVRFPLRVAAANTLVVTVLDAVISLHGLGAFAAAPPAERVLAVQLMVALMTLLTLMLGLQRDDRGRLVENLRAARQDAEGQADLLRTVFQTTSDGMSVYAADGTLLMANAAAGRLYPRLPAGVPTERFADYVEVLDAAGAPVPGARMPLLRALSGERIDSDDMTFRNLLDGSVTTVNVAAHGLPRSAGASWSGGAIIAFRDVTAQREAAAEVARAHDVYAGILSGATEQLIVAADLRGTVTVVNEGARRLLGVRADAAVGGDVCDLLDPAELADRALDLDLSSTWTSTWTCAPGPRCSSRTCAARAARSPGTGRCAGTTAPPGGWRSRRAGCWTPTAGPRGSWPSAPTSPSRSPSRTAWPTPSRGSARPSTPRPWGCCSSAWGRPPAASCR